MSAHLLVLGHGPLTGPGTLTSALAGRSAQLPVREVDLADGDPPPDLDDVAGVLCLGGLMDWDDDDPWLVPERTLLATAVAAGTPVFGICLGAQQLAVALGGEVSPLDGLHAAMPGLVRTEEAREDEVFAGWQDGATGLFHHHDSVTRLPDGAVPLLGGTDRTVPAWRDATGAAHAVQFHPEANLDIVTGWGDLRADDLPYDPETFRAEVARREPWLRAAGVALVARWLDVRVLPRTR